MTCSNNLIMCLLHVISVPSGLNGVRAKVTSSFYCLVHPSSFMHSHSVWVSLWPWSFPQIPNEARRFRTIQTEPPKEELCSKTSRCLIHIFLKFWKTSVALPRELVDSFISSSAHFTFQHLQFNTEETSSSEAAVKIQDFSFWWETIDHNKGQCGCCARRKE